MKALKGIEIPAPVHIGDVILENVADTGVDIVATKKCRIRQKSPEIQLTYLRKKETERASKKKIFSLFFVRKIP